MTWTSGLVTSNVDVFARIFNADGSPAGEPFIVEAPDEAAQSGTLLPGYAAGDLFAVAWSSNTALGREIFIRFYDTDGEPQGPAVPVNPDPGGQHAFIGGVALAGGGFAVTWRDQSSGNWDLMVSVYSPTGELLAGALQIDTETTGSQNIFDIEALPNGGFVVIWNDRQVLPDGEVEDKLMVSIFGADGTEVFSEAVATTEAPATRNVDMIGLEGGGFAVVLDDTDGVRENNLFVYDRAGVRIHAEVQPWSRNLNDDHGVALAGGGFVIVSNQGEVSNQDEEGAGYAQMTLSIRGADGLLVSEQVMAAPPGLGVVPFEILSLPQGGFVMSWAVATRFNAQPNDLFELLIQTFDETGAPIGQPVNIGPTGQDTRLAVGPDGAVTVTWLVQDNGGDVRMIHIPAGERVAAPLFILGTADAEMLQGAAGDDEIYGQDGDDLLQGLGGEDRMFGGHGLDRLEGGDGNDTLVGNEFTWPEERDELIGGAGDDLIYGERSDLIDGGSGYDRLIAVNARDWTLDMAATSIEYAVMGDGDDVIDASGQTVGVSVFAGAGDDRVTGSAFNDLIFGGAGYAHDILSGGDGDDALVGELGIDELRGGEGNDRLYFDAQDSVIDGGAGFDVGYIMTAVAGVGAAVDMAASSLEFVQDLAGEADTITAADAVQGVSIYAGAGADTVTGSAFNDVIWGEDGDDVIAGGAGNDVIVGGSGADRISGGLGNDALYGGAGDNAADIFVFEHLGAANADAVYDFVIGQDKLDLTAMIVSFDDVFIATAGSDSVVWVAGQQLATIVGVTGLTASDFIFPLLSSAPPEGAAPEVALVQPDPVLDDDPAAPVKPMIHPAQDDWLM